MVIDIPSVVVKSEYRAVTMLDDWTEYVMRFAKPKGVYWLIEYTNSIYTEFFECNDVSALNVDMKLGGYK